MKYRTVIKPGSLVLIKRIAIVEVLIGVILFAASFLANYEELYRDFQLLAGVRYDLFILVAASIFQLLITLVFFFQWYAESYELKDQELLHKHGVIFAAQNSLWLKDATAVEYTQGPLEKLMGAGTVVIYNHIYKKPVFIRSIEGGEMYVAMVRNAVDQAKNKHEGGGKPNIAALIKRGEHYRLEFKQTFRWDIREQRANKDLEKSIMKTLAGFLNADGGQLVIGVADDGTVTGLEKDFQTLTRKDRDGFENHFTLAFKTTLGIEFRHLVDLDFETVNEHPVCLINVTPSDRPVYLKANGSGEEFYVRTGNTTTPLSMSEARAYIEGHWK